MTSQELETDKRAKAAEQKLEVSEKENSKLTDELKAAKMATAKAEQDVRLANRDVESAELSTDKAELLQENAELLLENANKDIILANLQLGIAKLETGIAKVNAEKAERNLKKLQGEPHALQSCSLDELQQLKADMDLSVSRLSAALEAKNVICKECDVKPCNCSECPSGANKRSRV
jgi:hypothetical protein